MNIDYAYTSFKWENSAVGNAGVTCVIIAMSRRNIRERFIIKDFVRTTVSTISPYLTEAKTFQPLVTSRGTPLSEIPEMNFGNMPADGGELMFTDDEKNSLIANYPEAKKYMYRLVGAKELIQAQNQRWCLWLTDVPVEEIEAIPEIRDRINRVREIRLNSSRPKLANIPTLFAQITADPNKYKSALVLPSVSSERREYMPIRFADKNEVVSNLCLVIANAPLYLFAVITSRMHMVWLSAIGGKMKTDFRYSKDIVYNNYPIRYLSQIDKDDLAQNARDVLFIRENHSEKSLAELYDPDKMPDDLREVHHKLDKSVDRLYRVKPYNTDEDRLIDLFALYESMIVAEKEKAK